MPRLVLFLAGLPNPGMPVAGSALCVPGNHDMKLMRKLSNHVTNIKCWIKRNCPRLLRAVGIPATLSPFTINTGDKEPICIRPRAHSPLDLVKIKEFLNENLKNGVITESQSPWSAPIILATKPNGDTRVCVDYHALNRITEKDAYSLPRIDESFSQFAGVAYFTSLLHFNVT